MYIMIVCSFPTSLLVGGNSIVANELARYYQEAGHKITLASMHPKAIQGYSRSILGIETLDFRSGYGTKVQHIVGEFLSVYNPKACSFLRRQLQEKQPDCVHFQSLHNGVSAFGPRVTKDLGVPSIVSVHGVPPICAAFNLAKLPNYSKCSGPSAFNCLVCKRYERYRIPMPFRNYFFRQFASATSYITTPSFVTRDWLLSSGYSPEQVKVISHGVDVDRFRPCLKSSARGSNRFRVLFVGRVRAKKGVQYLIEACSKLVEKGHSVELGIVGDYRPNWMNQPFMRFEGPIGRDKLPRYYQEADILVQPSIIFESFGLTLLEGMASGIPVIATNMGAMPEVVGDCGIIVPPRDSRSLAQAIERLIVNPDLGRELGEKGRARVERMFTWDSKAVEYLDLLSSLVDKH